MNRRGSVLIASTWALAVVFASAMSLSLYAGLRIRAAKSAWNGAGTAAVFQSAANWAMTRLDEGCREGRLDPPEAWKDKLELDCIDEDSKLDLNAASFEQLERIAGSRSAEAVLAYRKTKHFEHVEEVELVPGLGADDLRALKDRSTVYSVSHRVNLNTAGADVLAAVIMTLPGAQDSLKASILSSVLSARASGTALTPADLAPVPLAEKLGLSASPDTLAALDALIPLVAAEPTVFRVRIRHAGRLAEAVIGPDREGGRSIFFWHESGAPHAA